MMLEEAKRRLLGARYQVMPVQGEPLHMVFWPPDKKGERRAEALDADALLVLAETITLPDEERRPVVDVRKVGVVARLRKVPMSTDAEGVPTVGIVFEVEGKGAVDSLPIDDIRDMLGDLVLIQFNTVQMRLEISKRSDSSGAA